MAQPSSVNAAIDDNRAGQNDLIIKPRHLMHKQQVLHHHKALDQNLYIAYNGAIPATNYTHGALRYNLLKHNTANFTFAEIKLARGRNPLTEKIVGTILESALMWKSQTYKRYGFVPDLPAPYFIYK